MDWLHRVVLVPKQLIPHHEQLKATNLFKSLTLQRTNQSIEFFPTTVKQPE